MSATETFDRDVRLRLMRRFIDTGRAPTVAEIARDVGTDEDAVRSAFHRLHDGHVIVLKKNSDAILMANPLSAVPTRFTARVGGRSYFGNCIWDVLGIPAMLGQDADITAECGDCGEPIELRARGDGERLEGEGVVHFGVRAAQWWDDIGFT